MKSNWYEHFFHGVALDVWRQAVTAEQTLAEVDFLVKVLEAQPGSRLLDVPCGNGRQSRQLAARGFRVAGVDISEEFIIEARAQAAADGVGVEWLHADMRRLPWKDEFHGAFCWGNSFGYLDHVGTVDFLAAVAGAIKPGGRFALETGVAAESILPKLQDRRWMQVGDILFLSAARYNVVESRLEIEYTFVRDGKVETREASSGVYTVAEIQRLLVGVGLRVIAVYGSLDQQPFQLGSPRLILVAEKCAGSLATQ
jgi:SAM-dependent methyltransferase